jgi:ABC-type multidrug transport system ATPase subunit
LRRGVGLVIEDSGSTNGTYINGRRIQTHCLAQGDAIRIGPFKFLHRDAEILRYDDDRQVHLHGYHLSVFLGAKKILDDVSLCALPGEITAVAGVSGAGKSTLLNALSGLVPATCGRVLVNESDLYQDWAAFRSLMGYVPQADIVHKELPLERALLYAAHLRLSRDLSEEQRAAQVTGVIGELGMEEQRRLAIRQMSGGQQKRASLAVELLARPRLLLLDEPTTGLDPGLRRQLMELLRDLSREQRTIILVTHDPDTLTYCDQMVFLASGGKTAFIGTPSEVLAYFHVPDHIEVYRRVEREKSPALWEEEFRQSPQFRKYAEQRLPASDARLKTAAAGISPGTRSTPSFRREDLSLVPRLAQRYLEVLVRDRRNFALLLLQAPLLAFILSLVSSAQALTGGATTGEANKVLLLMATCAIWLGTMNSAREVVKELPIYVRERLMGIGPVQYVLSKVAVLSGLCLLQSLLLLLVLSFKVQIPSDGVVFPGWLELYVSLSLTSLAAMAMGLLVSAVSSSQERAISIVPLVLIPQIILAGVIFKLSGTAEMLSWLSVAKWSVELLGATAGVPGGVYAASAFHQMSRWFLLVVMGIVFLAATVWLLRRKDTSTLARP